LIAFDRFKAIHAGGRIQVHGELVGETEDYFQGYLFSVLFSLGE